MERCKYCPTPIDSHVAKATSEIPERINRADKSARIIRNVTGVMWLVFLLRFIPFLRVGGGIINLVGLMLVPVWLIYWKVRYGRMNSAERTSGIMAST